jgi:copper resistance protein C
MKSIARLTTIVLLLAATNARATAFLDHSEPAVGSTVDEPPTEIRIWFTERLDPPFGQIQLFDRRGRPVTQNQAVVDSDDPTLLKLSIPLLKPGAYKVSWKVTSMGMRMTVGTFSFKVRKSKKLRPANAGATT